MKADAPTWNGKNRAFFFFSYEGLRSSNTDTVNAFVETPQFRQAVISGAAKQYCRANPWRLGHRAAHRVVLSPRPALSQAFRQPIAQVAGGLDIGRIAGAQGQYISFGDLSGGGPDGIPDIQFAQLSVPTISRGNQYNPRIDLNVNEQRHAYFQLLHFAFHWLGGDAAGRSRPMGDITTAPQNLFGMVDLGAHHLVQQD